MPVSFKGMLYDVGSASLLSFKLKDTNLDSPASSSGMNLLLPSKGIIFGRSSNTKLTLMFLALPVPTLFTVVFRVKSSPGLMFIRDMEESVSIRSGVPSIKIFIYLIVPTVPPFFVLNILKLKSYSPVFAIGSTVK